MSNRFWIVASGIVWFLGMALAVILFFQYANLRSELAERKIKIAEVELELQAKQKSLDTLQEKIARQQSQFAALEDSVIEVTQFLKQNSGRKDLIESLCDRNGANLAGLALTICANIHNVLGDSYYEYLQKLLQATLLRSREKFDLADEKYKQVQTLLESVNAPPEHLALLKALALEGRAYASYRQGKLDVAEGYVAAAKQILKPFPSQVSGFLALTDLKIMCERKKAVPEISVLHRRYKDKLSSAVDSASGNWIDYRKRDIDNFMSDPELEIVCPDLGNAA
ncbi:hypothetical protein [Parasphingorhabdus sp.]|uniref:hypothetical protein n=1 Tax=Parasphingorhabdus sp. TaxID=2709688 RepID=UPI003C758234